MLFRHLRETVGVDIAFARRTFPWADDGPGAASVHVVIIGLSAAPPVRRRLFDGDGERIVEHINAYLCAAPDAFVTARRQPLCDVPAMTYGSMMLDRPRGAPRNAGLLLDPGDRDRLLAEVPGLAPFIRPLLGGEEFLAGQPRLCLWLVDAPDALLAQSPTLRARIDGVRAFRQRSGRAQTRRLAATPTLFGEIRQPTSTYLLVPKVSSERRIRLPVGFVEPDVIASGSALVVPEAGLYHFGVLSSAMHDAWVRAVAGRMKSDLQYSASIVYNNFPWPDPPDVEARALVESAARALLDERDRQAPTALAALYRSGAMPADLRKAHDLLDATVDRLYRRDGYHDVEDRLAWLFDRHASRVRELEGSQEVLSARA